MLILNFEKNSHENRLFLNFWFPPTKVIESAQKKKYPWYERAGAAGCRQYEASVMEFLCDLNETKQKCNMWNLSINLGIDMTTDDRGTKMHVKLIFSLLKVSNRILFKFLESYFSSAHLQMQNYGYGVWPNPTKIFLTFPRDKNHYKYSKCRHVHIMSSHVSRGWIWTVWGSLKSVTVTRTRIDVLRLSAASRLSWSPG